MGRIATNRWSDFTRPSSKMRDDKTYAKQTAATPLGYNIRACACVCVSWSGIVCVCVQNIPLYNLFSTPSYPGKRTAAATCNAVCPVCWLSLCDRHKSIFAVFSLHIFCCCCLAVVVPRFLFSGYKRVIFTACFFFFCYSWPVVEIKCHISRASRVNHRVPIIHNPCF